MVVFDCSCNRTGAWAEERIVERTVAAMAVDRSFADVSKNNNILKQKLIQ